MMPYVVFALPRSRTFWLSQFLTYGDWVCGHEELRHARSMRDVKDWFSQPCIGTIETAAAPWWRLLDSDVTVVTIRRPVSDVVDSFRRIGWPSDHIPSLTKSMYRIDRKLDQIEARLPEVLSIRFETLATEMACARIFERCVPYQHDSAHWAALAPINMQVDVRALLRYYEAYGDQMKRLAIIAKQRTISGMARRAVRELDGVTIQQEPFDDFYNDSKALFREHMAITGQGIEDYAYKNLPLMRLLAQRGNLQVTTARCNGRVFGYLIAVTCESLDGVGIFEGMHMPFYASKEFPGLGMKLQRASIEALRKRGVDDLYFRAGTRGAGPRLGAIYRRLGAEDAGHLYRLRLKEAS